MTPEEREEHVKKVVAALGPPTPVEIARLRYLLMPVARKRRQQLAEDEQRLAEENGAP